MSETLRMSQCTTQRILCHADERACPEHCEGSISPYGLAIYSVIHVMSPRKTMVPAHASSPSTSLHLRQPACYRSPPAALSWANAWRARARSSTVS